SAGGLAVRCGSARSMPPDPREGFNPASFIPIRFTRTFFVPPVCGSGRMHGEPHVAKKLPHRPNMDHLRRQAKSLLADLEFGKKDAVETFREHLLAAEKLNDEQIRNGNFRLADAQCTIA